jgi:hypothetical protein
VPTAGKGQRSVHLGQRRCGSVLSKAAAIRGRPSGSGWRGFGPHTGLDDRVGVVAAVGGIADGQHQDGGDLDQRGGSAGRILGVPVNDGQPAGPDFGLSVAGSDERCRGVIGAPGVASGTAGTAADQPADGEPAASGGAVLGQRLDGVRRAARREPAARRAACADLTLYTWTAATSMSVTPLRLRSVPRRSTDPDATNRRGSERTIIHTRCHRSSRPGSSPRRSDTRRAGRSRPSAVGGIGAHPNLAGPHTYGRTGHRACGV